MKPLWLLVLLPAGLAADAVSVGVRGGVPLRNALDAEGRFKSVPRRHTFGPTVEVHLPAGLSISADALFRRVQVETGGQTSSANSWDFPVMLRKRFGFGPARPFLGGGLVFNHLGGLVTQGPREFVRSTTNGLVFGAGVELRAPKVRISPELRYSHRNNDRLLSAVGGLLRSNRDQIDFLVGLTF
ncbi:MAG: PorT family protein [Acidobacteria bacterium]|nr:PorT family protein [Acidobacteriota bacterium]